VKLLIWIKEALANNPERIKSWLIAAFALAVYYWPELADDRDIWLQFAGSILFGGELVRQAVTPSRKLDGPAPPQPGERGAVSNDLIIGLLLGALAACVVLLVLGRL
jgi:hypothetical protein